MKVIITNQNSTQTRFLAAGCQPTAGQQYLLGTIRHYNRNISSSDTDSLYVSDSYLGLFWSKRNLNTFTDLPFASFFYLKQKDLLQFSFSKSVLSMFKVLKNYIIDVIKNGVLWVFTWIPKKLDMGLIISGCSTRTFFEGMWDQMALFELVVPLKLSVLQIVFLQQETFCSAHVLCICHSSDLCDSTVSSALIKVKWLCRFCCLL